MTAPAPQSTTPFPAATAPPLALMRNPVRDYDWGSTTVLARLQRREPGGGPEAELWMGAHPSAPSSLLLPDEPGGGTEPAAVELPEIVAAAPQAVLGEQVVERFGARLPFMLKVLAVARPLSLQVHPDAERARAVHDPAGGSAYVDAFHKPELIVAVEEMEAIFGFRPAVRAATLLRALGVPRVTGLGDGLAEALHAGHDEAESLHRTFATLLDWREDGVEGLDGVGRLVTEVAAAAERLSRSEDPVTARAARWVRTLADLHPRDPLVLAPLLLDVLRLAPGEALFVPAGVPHAYLSGCGVEVLAASDNVVRAGLTSKAVDTVELLEIVDTRPRNTTPTEPSRLSPAEVAWRPPVPDFQLTRLQLDGDGPVQADPAVGGPQILLCVRGRVTVRSETGGGVAVTLTGGRSAFATAGAGPLTVTGEGELYRAAPGQP